MRAGARARAGSRTEPEARRQRARRRSVSGILISVFVDLECGALPGPPMTGNPVRLAVLSIVLLAGTQACASGGRKPAPATTTACSDARTELGLSAAPGKNDMRVSYDSMHGTLIVVPPPEPTVVRGYGLHAILAMMRFEGRPPVLLPEYTMDFLVSGAQPRAYEERLVTLQLDSTSLKIGTGSSSPAPTGGSGLIEHIVVVISPAQQLQIIRANKVRGSIGSTPFEISDRQLAGLRAMALYARCGAQ